MAFFLSFMLTTYYKVNHLIPKGLLCFCFCLQKKIFMLKWREGKVKKEEFNFLSLPWDTCKGTV